MQKYLNPTNLAHSFLEKKLHKTGIFLDGTLGNGFDTLYIAKKMNADSKIFSFDIQQKAIDTSLNLLKNEIDNEKLKSISLILDSHTEIKKYITKEKIVAGIFNFGYLPKGDKNITTKKESSFLAIKNSMDLLELNGILVLVFYTGHLEGKLEKNYILDNLKYISKRDFAISICEMINHSEDAPSLCIIEKVRNNHETNKAR